jgi:branched-chain amino acid aminotransferase
LQKLAEIASFSSDAIPVKEDMFVFLNGRFVPEKQAVVSVFDRSFLYGDGLFETMLVQRGRIFRWAQHLERLKRGAGFLKIALPFNGNKLARFASTLIRKNGRSEALLRLTLSRGVGPRGYSPKGADHPSLVMSLHPAPELSPSKPALWKLTTSSVRLPANDAVAQYKTCNKLAQILARSEAEVAGSNEALLVNTDGHVIEGASSNLFWFERGNVLCTAALNEGILAGVTRATILEIARSLGIKTREAKISSAQLLKTQGVFMSLSSFGIAEAVSLDRHALKRCPLVQKLRMEYLDLVRRETA